MEFLAIWIAMILGLILITLCEMSASIRRIADHLSPQESCDEESKSQLEEVNPKTN